MKKFKTRKQGSLFTLLLKNYIIFTVILIIFLSSIFITLLYGLFNNIADIDAQQLEDNKEYLIQENYDDFPFSNRVGEDGGIVILNENSETIYNTTSLDISLSLQELLLLPQYGFEESITTSQLVKPNENINYQVLYERNNEDGSLTKATYIFDKNYHLIYGSGNDITGDLSEKEFQLLSQTYYPNYYLSRFPYQNKDNLPYTLLLVQQNNINDLSLHKFMSSFSRGAILFFLFYCLMILFFILWLRRKISNPLRILNNYFHHYEIGHEVTTTYKGPKEFKEIFDNFSKMANRLNDSEIEKQKLETDKQAMLAGISHDLKTPITVIQGYAKALNDHIIPPQEQAQYLKTIETKASTLNQLINTFYEYNKLNHTNYQLTLEHIDICNYLRDYIASHYSELETSGFIIDVDIPEEHFFCSLDNEQFMRVLDNIVGNAMKYNPAETTLFVGLQQRNNTIVITIADDGIGIPKEIGNQIFAPFIVGEDARTGSGSGLGLSIAKKIVEEHQGQIHLYQFIPPYKTTFEIILPLEQ